MSQKSNSLADKLKALGVQVGARNLPQPRRRVREEHPIEQVIEGRVETTAQGETFVTETGYPAGHRHGRVRLRPETDLAPIAAWAKAPALAQIPLEQWAFLDTETSGLSGGTGTYAFLVGVGRFEGDQFRLAQFFMRDPTEEPAQLAALSEFLAPCRALVTFNGKSFDGPLLETRYTLHRQSSPLAPLIHLDLLPLARRLWRERLPSRRLGHLETEILGAERTEEDTPGWQIPQLYFDYLRTGDARPLEGVFYHNSLDVLAMAALLNQMGQMLADPLGEAVAHALELVAIGRLYEALGEVEQAVALFEAGMARDDLPEESYWETQRRLSFVLKRNDELEAAVAVWELAAEGRQIYAHVELAKFYEHKQREYDQALQWTETALTLLSGPRHSRSERRQWLAALKHRQARLERKLKK